MGMNTVIQILNDAWWEIEKDPKRFVEIIESKMNNSIPDHIDDHIKVMKTHHSGDLVTYISGGNTIIEPSPSKIVDLLSSGFYDYVDSLIDELQYKLKEAKRARKEYMEENEPLLYKAQKVVKK